MMVRKNRETTPTNDHTISSGVSPNTPLIVVGLSVESNPNTVCASSISSLLL